MRHRLARMISARMVSAMMASVMMGSAMTGLRIGHKIDATQSTTGDELHGCQSSCTKNTFRKSLKFSLLMHSKVRVPASSLEMLQYNVLLRNMSFDGYS
jgi:hypothetical protein